MNSIITTEYYQTFTFMKLNTQLNNDYVCFMQIK